MKLAFWIIFACTFFYFFPSYPCERCDKMAAYVEERIQKLKSDLYIYGHESNHDFNEDVQLLIINDLFIYEAIRLKFSQM